MKLEHFDSAEKVFMEALQYTLFARDCDVQTQTNSSLSTLHILSRDPVVAEKLAAAQSIAEKVRHLILRIRMDIEQAHVTRRILPA